jgi:hypothetical protein
VYVSHTETARELWRYKLGSVGVQEIRYDKRGTVRTNDYTIFCRKRKSSDIFIFIFLMTGIVDPVPQSV